MTHPGILEQCRSNPRTPRIPSCVNELNQMAMIIFWNLVLSSDKYSRLARNLPSLFSCATANDTAVKPRVTLLQHLVLHQNFATKISFHGYRKISKRHMRRLSSAHHCDRISHCDEYQRLLN